MTAEKKGESSPKASATSGPRKTWVPKTPVENMLDLIRKQEKKVAELQQELDREKASLNKLLQAKKVLEAT